jgi:3-phosphoshikimate 1-carboxyvinyltransferase
MKWRIRPSELYGTIAIPPSKSHTIRALLVATLCNGTSTIRRPLLHGDGASAIGASIGLGATVDRNGTDLVVKGIGATFDGGGDAIDMGNSGTSTNLFTSVAALGSRKRRLDGDDSLRSRPFRPLLDALTQLGAIYEIDAGASRDLPFTIQGPIKGGSVTVNGRSSQFVSSLLFACPLLEADSTVMVENVREQPYIALTLWWLEKQGIILSHENDLSRFSIKGGQAYTPFDMAIPSDFSSATFAACAAAITGSSIKLTGLDFTDPQGDKGVFEVLKNMGATVAFGNNGVTVSASSKGIRGAAIDLNAMPDALPAISVAACMAFGETSIVNVAHARDKETDRITVMREELSKMGANIVEREDGLTVRKSALRGAHVNGRNDHRVVMALALAGMVAKGETVIDTAEAAAVTYPDFVADFNKLGADIIVEK